MKAYLVINKGESSTFVPFKENYQVFIDRQKAIDCALLFGFDSPMGITDTIGVMSLYYCGDIKVEFMPIEIQ